MIPFVRTSLGLLPAHRAKQIEQIEKDHAAKKREATEADILTKAGRIGLRLEEVKALWVDGPAVVQRAMRRAVAKIPPAVLRAAYPCAGCKKIRDDNYKADCERKGVSPCFVMAMLRGCPSLEAAPTRG